MAVFTSQLRSICEYLAELDESVDNTEINNVLAIARPKIFDFTYPIFENTYKSVLENKILRHYYMQEIGQETYGLWKFHLENMMNEIMPYYNKLYDSANIEFNPLNDYNMTTRRTNTGSKNTNEDNKTTEEYKNKEQKVKNENINRDNLREDDFTNKERTINSANSDKENSEHYVNRFSDTPQGGLSDVERNRYLTNATIDDTTNKENQNTLSSGTSEGENKGSRKNTDNESNIILQNGGNSGNRINSFEGNKILLTTDEYIESVVGKQSRQSYSKLLLEYRDTIINIDMMIIEELKPLFMGLWR